MNSSKRLLSILPVIYCFLLFAPLIASAIEVFGDVSGVWGPENNPYTVIADVRVPPGQSLEIQPGCLIEFEGYYRFIVDSLATFTAIGTESDSIIFTAQNRYTGWNGLRMYYPDSTSAISYCRFERGRGADHNQFSDYTRAWGGAIYLFGGGLQIANSHFIDNRAWEGYGGAIYALQANIKVMESKLEYNLAGFGGSAIYADSAIIKIENSSFYMDSTWYDLGGEDGGGAIGCLYSIAEIRGNIINNNFCGWNGGGIQITFCNASIIDNAVLNNGAYYYGGGICAGAGRILVSNNIIYNNYIVRPNQSAGGGIAFGDSVILLNNTICGNYCPIRGGGIYSWTQNPLDTLRNNIIWGNVAYLDSQIYCAGQAPPIIYNDIQGGWPGDGNINADPLFFGHDDFHITWENYPWVDSTKSPCIDTGDPSSPSDSDGTRADMGAYPFDPNYQDIIDDIVPLPRNLFLAQNYPNPFNAQTTISFDLPQSGLVTLSIYDITGRKVAIPLSSVMPAGSHKYLWDAKDFSSGVYFASLEFDRKQSNIRIVLLK